MWLFVSPWTEPTRLLCPWNSPDQNIRVGCHSHLEGIFQTQGSNLGLLHCRQILYHLNQILNVCVCVCVCVCVYTYIYIYKDWGNASISQETPKLPAGHQKPSIIYKTDSLEQIVQGSGLLTPWPWTSGLQNCEVDVTQAIKFMEAVKEAPAN